MQSAASSETERMRNGEERNGGERGGEERERATQFV